MRCLVLLPIIILASCATPDPTPDGITSRGPGAAYHCLAPRLSGPGLRQHTQTTSSGWWMDIEALAGPPTGWYGKGRVEYASGSVSYVPDGATLGIAGDVFEERVRAALRACGST